MRFTIRDLLWLMVVAALALGWWLDRRQFDATDRSIIRSFKKQQAAGRDWLEYRQLSPDADPK